jgi:voltage-gated potassium channel
MSLPGITRPHLPPTSRRTPLVYRARAISVFTAVVGGVVLLLGILSGLRPAPEVFRDFLVGYDPPFDAIAGFLLLVLSLRIGGRSPVAYIFSLLAPALTVFIAIFSPNLYSIAAAGASVLLVAVIYPYRAGFYYGSATGPEATQLLVVAAALLSLLFGIVGTRWLAGQFQPPVAGWGDSLYFTIATVSTNGSNFTPKTDIARLFTVLLILFGVGTFLSAVVVLFLPLLERRLEAITSRLERAQMEDLNDHVIICGTTTEAKAVADSLRELGVRSVMVSNDPAALESLRAEGYRVHRGDPSSEEALESVGLPRARALIASQSTDAENLLTVITAPGMAPGLRIVAVANQSQSLPKFQKAGANEAISVVSVAAKLVSAAALERGNSTGTHTHAITR